MQQNIIKQNLNKKWSLSQWIIVFFLIIAIFFTGYKFFQIKSKQDVLPLGFRPISVEEEINGYKAQLGKTKDNFIVLSKLANSYIKQAKITGDSSWYLLAEKSAKESLLSSPKNNYQAILILASISMAKHDFTNAINLAEQTKVSPNFFISALGIKFDAYIALGKIGEADKVLNEIEKNLKEITRNSQIINKDPIHLTRQALVSFLIGDTKDANDKFILAINNKYNTNEVKAWVYTIYSMFLSNSGKLKESEENVRFALNSISNYIPAIVQLSEIYKQKNEWNNVITLIKPIEEKISRSDLSIKLAEAYKALNDINNFNFYIDKAEKTLIQEKNSANFGHRRDYIKLLLYKNTPESIKKSFEVAQEEKEIRKDWETLVVSIETEIKNNKLNYAKDDLVLLKKQGIKNAQIEYLNGLLAEKEKLPKKDIIAYYKKALEINPNFDYENSKYINDFISKNK